MKILVTGSAGFIGFHTSKRLLDSGYDVIGLDNLNNYYDINLKKDRLKILQEYDGFTFHKIDINTGSVNEPFHKPFFFILNIAVGGNWPGSPNNETQFPQKMYVDYIRVFQLK